LRWIKDSSQDLGENPIMSKQNRVIVVDDDKAVRDSLKFSLELEGLQVHTCESAQSLLDYPGLTEADCLVVDYRMPERNGLDLRQVLVARHITAPAILITAPVSEGLRRRAKAAGFFTVLEKPLLDDMLLRNIHAAIDNHHSAS
jgi:two-component system response regulator FixJ